MFYLTLIYSNKDTMKQFLTILFSVLALSIFAQTASLNTAYTSFVKAENAFEKNDIPFIKYIWDLLIYNVNKPSKEDDDLYLSETMKQRNIVDIDWCLTTFNMSHTTNGVSEGDGSIDLVTQEVLSLWSEKDIVVLEYMIDETVSALSNARKVVLKNSGHSPLVDCPDALYKVISNFF
jgi:pimeloyl-ACP methyl ester carboxylesterase